MRKEQNKKSIREYENDKHNYGITLVAFAISRKCVRYEERA